MRIHYDTKQLKLQFRKIFETPLGANHGKAQHVIVTVTWQLSLHKLIYPAYIHTYVLLESRENLVKINQRRCPQFSLRWRHLTAPNGVQLLYPIDPQSFSSKDKLFIIPKIIWPANDIFRMKKKTAANSFAVGMALTISFLKLYYGLLLYRPAGGLAEKSMDFQKCSFSEICFLKYSLGYQSKN